MDLTKGPLLKQFLVFAFPILLTTFMQQMYHTADVMVVGKFADDIALAAVGATGQITALLVNLFVGISSATNILCAQARGAGDKQRERRIIHTSLIFGAGAGIFLAVAGCVFSPFLLDVIDVPAEVRGEAGKYMCIIFLGQPASMLYNFCSSIFRARGNSRISMRILLTTGAVNVLLNLVFVIGFHLDAAGVALATIIANYLSVLAALYVLFRRDGEFRLSFFDIRFDKRAFFDVVKLGIPTGLNSILFNLSATIVARAANGLGTTVVASVSAANSVTNITHTFGNASCTALVSFAAQNYGAGTLHRVDRLLKSVVLTTQGLFLLLNLAITLYYDLFLGMFTNNPEVVEMGFHKLILTAWGYHFHLAAGQINSCSRGYGKSIRPTIINITAICLVRVIWVAFFFPLVPETAPLTQRMLWLYVSIPLSWALSFFGQLVDFCFIRRGARKKLCMEGKLSPEDEALYGKTKTGRLVIASRDGTK